ncbi:GspE/PulE family protein [Rubinisphaera margarita]|uniref:GspE/PulE family protein n=1 Tax=Rubinisphaera margarita TaxID=2909586 RepID=UPI001EE87860|nr:GspE/PulE family protein [Rubinisphaera margarita]MCG6158355.1 GspE/PulE family protein [Rubinisphaera margarita]
MNSLRSALVILLFAVGTVGVAQAQPETPEDAAPATAPAPTTATGAPRAANDYPPNPFIFYRGNVVLDNNRILVGDATVSAPRKGYYFSLGKLVPIFAIFFLWCWSTRWAQTDSQSLKVRPQFWMTNILLGGLFGFLLVVTMPSFLLGFVLLLAGYGGTIGTYVYERNQKVPDSAKVMTPRHIRNVVIRTLAKYGINIGSGTVKEQAVGPPIVFLGKSKEGGRSKTVESSRGYMSAKELVYDAILRRATDIHLEPKEDEMAVRLRIDGVMYPTEPFDPAVGQNVVNIIKVLSAMDITEKRKPQDGSFRAEMDFREIDFRVATQGTRFGEKMVMRILDQSNSVSSLAQLGMRKQVQDGLRSVINQPHGLFLTCGPTGAGKSTTLYAALGEIDSYQRNIITIEDPIEYKMEKVTQIEINNKAGQTFAGSLRSVLRQDPDVVMIGEIRDAETALIACQAANTGHMVFSTVHANETFSALYRMMDLGVEPFMLSSSLSAILGQRLARRLCNDCKVPYKPKPEFLKKANLPASKIENFYKPPTNPEGQCPTCGGLGYKGRIGVYELLELSERMRDMIRDSAAITQIKAEARKNGMLYMREEGLRLVVKGVTSVDEMLRVVK